LVSLLSARPAKHPDGPLTPVKATTDRAGFTIETVGDTLGQASPQNVRIIVRVVGPDHKLVKPAQVALVDKAGNATKPVFREDRKVGHEENTGLPVSLSNGGPSVDFQKLFGPKGSYAYTKVDWPKALFTADKNLQVVMPGGQSFVIPLTALAK